MDHAQRSPVSCKRPFWGQSDLRMMFRPGYWLGEGCRHLERTGFIAVVPTQFALGCPQRPSTPLPGSPPAPAGGVPSKSGESTGLYQLKSDPHISAEAFAPRSALACLSRWPLWGCCCSGSHPRSHHPAADGRLCRAAASLSGEQSSAQGGPEARQRKESNQLLVNGVTVKMLSKTTVAA